MIARDQPFKHCTIFLDGSSFYNCRFEQCRLVIGGTLPCVMDQPVIVDCDWMLEGPAKTTFQILAGLNKSGGGLVVSKLLTQFFGAEVVEQAQASKH